MRILVVNDISCVGKCSLTVALPIIYATGVTCDVLPTAILSTHTGGFEGYTFRDLTEDIPFIIEHWTSLNLKFDAIYSGYLGSKKQVEYVKLAKQKLLKEGGIMIVDPVLGDNGRLYAHFDNDFVREMAELCKIADYILPNSTEACLLTNTPYKQFKNKEEAISVLDKLSLLCKNALITGINLDDRCYVMYKSKCENKSYSTVCVDGAFHGTGDVFSSMFASCITKGINYDDSIKISTDFTCDAVIQTKVDATDRKYGVNFESKFAKYLPIIEGLLNNKK